MKFVLSFICVFLASCSSVNNIGHYDDYHNAKEATKLKLPANSLPTSNRYDIPSIKDPTKTELVKDTAPPDYLL